MALNGFGPPLKVERTEKHWIDDEDWKYFYKDTNYCRELIAEHWLWYWLTDFKFYGAERVEDNN